MFLFLLVFCVFCGKSIPLSARHEGCPLEKGGMKGIRVRMKEKNMSGGGVGLHGLSFFSDKMNEISIIQVMEADQITPSIALQEST